ncbi:bifunctional metallophosphatase/5'-nucleotidase [Xylanibacter muris]|nr:5'-nucleotidase C-terminal domain-containing protein [Xylanibacter muris]
MNKTVLLAGSLLYININATNAQTTVNGNNNNMNESTEIRIIQTSDVHGCIFPYDFIERKETNGSLARVASYIKKARKESPEGVILLDNGDFLQGQPTCYFYNYMATGERNIAADAINYIGYDAVAMGNHDIETGHAVYDKWINELGCPVLGANIIETATGKPYLKPYTIIDRNGIRTAVIGLITPAIPHWLNESLWSGLRFEKLYETAEYWLNHVMEKEKPDIVIGLFHSGWDGGIKTRDYTEDEAEKVARNLPGFDAILYGHDHTIRKEWVGNISGDSTLCLNPANNAMAVAELRITVENKGGKKTVCHIDGDIVDIRNEKPDAGFLETFSKQYEKITEFVNKPIGYITQDITTRDCFFGSSAFTDLIHNLQLKITEADISLCAPLSFDITVNRGELKMSDMFKLYKYENQICVLKMTGSEIRKHLEMSYGQWVNTMSSENDHIMLLDKKKTNDNQRFGFKNLTFNFDSAAGIDYEVDVTRPAGSRVTIKRMSNGRKFDEKKWYKVVTNSYRANGGGELLTNGAGIDKDSLKTRIIYESTGDQRFYLTKAISEMKVISPKPNNNWKFVPETWAAKAIERDRKLIFKE